MAIQSLEVCEYCCVDNKLVFITHKLLVRVHITDGGVHSVSICSPHCLSKPAPNPSLYSWKLTKYLKRNLSSLEVMAAGTWRSELRHVGPAIRKQCVWGWGPEFVLPGGGTSTGWRQLSWFCSKGRVPLLSYSTSRELLRSLVRNKAYKHIKQCDTV